MVANNSEVKTHGSAIFFVSNNHTSDIMFDTCVSTSSTIK